MEESEKGKTWKRHNSNTQTRLLQGSINTRPQRQQFWHLTLCSVSANTKRNLTLPNLSQQSYSHPSLQSHPNIPLKKNTCHQHEEQEERHQPYNVSESPLLLPHRPSIVPTAPHPCPAPAHIQKRKHYYLVREKGWTRLYLSLSLFHLRIKKTSWSRERMVHDAIPFHYPYVSLMHKETLLFSKRERVDMTISFAILVFHLRIKKTLIYGMK